MPQTRVLITVKTYPTLSKKVEERFAVIKKLPYKFSYVFEDETGKSRKLMIED